MLPDPLGSNGHRQSRGQHNRQQRARLAQSHPGPASQPSREGKSFRFGNLISHCFLPSSGLKQRGRNNQDKLMVTWTVMI